MSTNFNRICPVELNSHSHGESVSTKLGKLGDIKYAFFNCKVFDSQMSIVGNSLQNKVIF